MKKEATPTVSGNSLQDVSETNKHDSSRQIIEQHKIEDSPFTAWKHGDAWHLCLGKYRLTEILPSLEACQEEAKDTSWQRLMAIMKIMCIEHDAEKSLLATMEKQPQKN